MDNFRGKFVDEANDLINALEKSLLELESNPTDSDVIQSVFRIMHSLKGGSAMFGFNKIDQFTHYLENIYDLIRNGKLQVDNEILNITLDAVDHLRNLLQEPDDNDTTNSAQHELLMTRIKNIVAGNNGQQTANTSTPTGTPVAAHDTQQTSTYYINFKPHADIFNYGTNPLFLIDDLCDLGDAKVVARTANIPDYEHLVATQCYTYWDIFLATDAGINLISEVFLFVDDQCDLLIRKISEINLLNEPSFTGIIDEAIRNGKNIEVDQLMLLTNELEKVYQKRKSDSEGEKKSAVNMQGSTISSIRVSSEKLDNLIDWVSELVTVQARLSLCVQENNMAALVPISEEIEKISRRLRDDVFSIRLIPIENIATRFQRLVRELSRELNKDAVLKIEGADTELDKNIIESINDPLMHIVRNSMDHGIESADVRKMLGKPAKATVMLKAFYSGSSVIIQISDDGSGIDVDKIREKAVAKGLLQPDAQPTDKELINMIFLPGFTTAQKVTNVSGRGVGMDVVKRKISDIRGEVEITTERNKGTTTTIKLPITLSIIDGLLVSIDSTKYVIPLTSVHKCYEFEHAEIASAVNNMIRADNIDIACIDLRKMFGIESEHPNTEHVIAVQYDDTIVGLTVDEIDGQYQAVLKPLGKLYKRQQAFSGASILGDGTVALVIDTNKLIADYTTAGNIETGNQNN